MKKIVAGLSMIGMAAALAACGSKTETPVNDGLANETVFNEELPVDDNLTVTDNAGDAAFGNDLSGNVLDPAANAL